jgi:AraC-like DNA-binding protein
MGDIMDYYITIWTVVVFVENRLQTGFDYAELEKATGFSLPHLRAVFARYTGRSLARYVLSRRIAHAAFDMIHGDEKVFNAAVRYGFDNPDTFTRSFRRITGMTPREFRRQRPQVGRSMLCAGVYGVSERIESMDKKIITETGGTVLYGVPRVGYGVYGCTPFPICLKAAANYLGDDLDYDDVMVTSGAAFRLVWDESCWNGGNVDVMLAYDDPIKVYQNGIVGLGREFKLLGRKNQMTESDYAKFSSFESTASKEDFMTFIKEQIDKGRPCIALGIIGPPEACLVTGYRDNGQTLLGWNFFQDSPECASGIRKDDSGYFITDKWWENEETIAVMSMGEKTFIPADMKQIIDNATQIMTGRKHGSYAKGILAYDAWKTAITDESQFPKEPMSIMVERLMCQGDGMDCLADGRDNARKFFEKAAAKHPEEPLYREIAAQFGIVTKAAYGMYETLGGWERNEKQMSELAKPEIRSKLAGLIDCCKAADSAALELIKKLRQTL